jgi:tetratricopeptide (TPR) repeat protein
VLLRRLVLDFPKRVAYRQDYGKALTNQAFLLRLSRRAEESLAAYRVAVEVQQRLVEEAPKVTELQRDLARTYNDMGFLLITLGRLDEADVAYSSLLPMRRNAIAGDFDHENHNDLAGTCVNLAILRLDQKRPAEAKALLDEALPHHEAALRQFPKMPIYRNFYHNHLMTRIRVEAALGHRMAARAAAIQLSNLGWAPRSDAYDAASSLALCIEEDEILGGAQFYADEAMETLGRAVARGWANPAQLKNDASFKQLRGRRDFQNLMEKLGASSKVER